MRVVGYITLALVFLLFAVAAAQVTWRRGRYTIAGLLGRPLPEADDTGDHPFHSIP